MARLIPPSNGVTVRMYRQGHGDCFLLALPREGGGAPYYVLIDCGVKPGSQAFLDHKAPIGDIVKHVHDACGGKLDLVILTHEHQDHLNGIWKEKDPYFKDFKIDEAWLAWTEDPDNALANELRRRHRDQLLGLLAARRELELAAGENDPAVHRLDALLAMELGGDAERPDTTKLLAAANDPKQSINKKGLKLVKDKASEKRGCRYLSPGGGAVAIEGTEGIRAFILGPPESAELIVDEDPKGEEGFPRDHSFSFSEAASLPKGHRASPFSRRFCISADEALDGSKEYFVKRYGSADQGTSDADQAEVTSNPPWRRIDNEWLYAAETMALKLNTGINNTSLVVAIELPRSKKILFFSGDAQRGNWISWKNVEWKDGAKTVTTRELLSRTVLYKVGHHGSHNATLAGQVSDDHPNLSWMALGPYAAEFTAMITAVNEWALKKNNPPWVHPLPSIKLALLSKSRGRLFQTDENRPQKPENVSAAEWKKFKDRAKFEDLYFDLRIHDE